LISIFCNVDFLVISCPQVKTKTKHLTFFKQFDKHFEMAESEDHIAWDRGVQDVSPAVLAQKTSEDDTAALVIFYAHWCGHCQNTQPTINALAKDKSARVFAVDTTKYRTALQHPFDENAGVPQLFVRVKSVTKPWVGYQGERTFEKIKDFISLQTREIGLTGGATQKVQSPRKPRGPRSPQNSRVQKSPKKGRKSPKRSKRTPQLRGGDCFVELGGGVDGNGDENGDLMQTDDEFPSPKPQTQTLNEKYAALFESDEESDAEGTGEEAYPSPSQVRRPFSLWKHDDEGGDGSKGGKGNKGNKGKEEGEGEMEASAGIQGGKSTRAKKVRKNKSPRKPSTYSLAVSLAYEELQSTPEFKRDHVGGLVLRGQGPLGQRYSQLIDEWRIKVARWDETKLARAFATQAEKKRAKSPKRRKNTET
jgi:thiol-disulfide isomerase/thioredoxin